MPASGPPSTRRRTSCSCDPRSGARSNPGPCESLRDAVPNGRRLPWPENSPSSCIACGWMEPPSEPHEEKQPPLPQGSVPRRDVAGKSRQKPWRIDRRNGDGLSHAKPTASCDCQAQITDRSMHLREPKTLHPNARLQKFLAHRHRQGVEMRQMVEDRGRPRWGVSPTTRNTQ